jgi:cytochrome P450
MFFYLSRNETCYQKLASEVRSTFESSADIRGGSQLSSCRYLRACIDETLRICPPVPGTLWREMVSGDDTSQPFIIDGPVVPPDTTFGVSTYALHHNEEYFPEPFSYQPERWLEPAKDFTTRRQMQDAFFAFSVGPRVCASKHMAYLEISLVVAKTF